MDSTNKILIFFVYLTFSVLLLWGGAIIIINENVFGKFYESFQTTVTLPTGMKPLSSDKIATIREKSTTNLVVASIMIIAGVGSLGYAFVDLLSTS